ncbi:aspartyl/asparaginyl beta-hydroxylase domain-containing protein [bacterium]|nr:aspartyl/asparaginyl beta-hydroxylase domain-containing protein [bacterium]
MTYISSSIIVSSIIVSSTIVSILLTTCVLMCKNMDFDWLDNVNDWMEKHCEDQAVFSPLDYEWTQLFRDNWRAIRKEYRQYISNNDRGKIPYQYELNQVIGDCDSDRNKWRTLYLRAFNRDTKLIKRFPLTKRLIDQVPCTLAYFSILEPGAKLEPHVGVYKGVIRYHLGLEVPKDYRKCYINVDNHFMHWRKGKDIMFDDTYLHYVENNTNEERVVLFLDIRRNFDNWFVNLVNSCLLYFIKSNDILDQLITKINHTP